MREIQKLSRSYKTLDIAIRECVIFEDKFEQVKRAKPLSFKTKITTTRDEARLEIRIYGED